MSGKFLCDLRQNRNFLKRKRKKEKKKKKKRKKEKKKKRKKGKKEKGKKEKRKKGKKEKKKKRVIYSTTLLGKKKGLTPPHRDTPPLYRDTPPPLTNHLSKFSRGRCNLAAIAERGKKKQVEKVKSSHY